MKSSIIEATKTTKFPADVDVFGRANERRKCHQRVVVVVFTVDTFFWWKNLFCNLKKQHSSSSWWDNVAWMSYVPFSCAIVSLTLPPLRLLHDNFSCTHSRVDRRHSTNDANYRTHVHPILYEQLPSAMCRLTLSTWTNVIVAHARLSVSPPPPPPHLGCHHQLSSVQLIHGNRTAEQRRPTTTLRTQLIGLFLSSLVFKAVARYSASSSSFAAIVVVVVVVVSNCTHPVVTV